MFVNFKKYVSCKSAQLLMVSFLGFISCTTLNQSNEKQQPKATEKQTSIPSPSLRPVAVNNSVIPKQETKAAPAPQVIIQTKQSENPKNVKSMTMRYLVKPGDSLSLISGKIYGSVSQWKQLALENNIKNPARIFPGDVIFYNLQNANKEFAQAQIIQDLPRRDKITVQEGDTLSAIAKSTYGTAAAWRLVWKQNPQIKDPNKLYPGTKLTINQPQYMSANTVTVTNTSTNQPQTMLNVKSAQSEVSAQGNQAQSSQTAANRDDQANSLSTDTSANSERNSSQVDSMAAVDSDEYSMPVPLSDLPEGVEYEQPVALKSF